MGETCTCVGGKWRYLWRAADANGELIDASLTARRDASAARAFLNKAIECVRLHRPVTIVTDKTATYRHVVREVNQRYNLHSGSIQYIDRKWNRNGIESNHTALKRLLGHRQSFRSLRLAKATLSGIETFCAIKNGNVHHKQSGVSGETQFIGGLFLVVD